MRRLLDDLRTLDRQTTLTLLLTAFVLVTVQFRGKSQYWSSTELLRSRFTNPMEMQYACQVAWALTTVVMFGVVPLLFSVFVLRLRPAQFGFRLRGLGRHSLVYAGLFVLMLPLIWWASTRPEFRLMYPFARLARTNDFLFVQWELFYFLQFCALEMFFRGFMLFNLERRFGYHAIFVMTIPYAMIHFSKPMPEAFGAIFAGLILGYMALRTRSFYGGIAIHYAVALTMDLLARSPVRP